MSIHDEIYRLETSGDLIRYTPISAQPARRCLFLSKDLKTNLAGPDTALHLREQAGQVHNAFTHWTTGGFVRVNEKGIPIFLKPLEPPPDGVWEIKVTEPIVQVRIFCCFALPNILIATHARGRNELGSKKSRAWKGAMMDCRKIWKTIFPNDVPHHGVRSGDYITENCDDFPVP